MGGLHGNVSRIWPAFSLDNAKHYLWFKEIVQQANLTDKMTTTCTVYHQYNVNITCTVDVKRDGTSGKLFWLKMNKNKLLRKIYKQSVWSSYVVRFTTASLWWLVLSWRVNLLWWPSTLFLEICIESQKLQIEALRRKYYIKPSASGCRSAESKIAQLPEAKWPIKTCRQKTGFGFI